MKINFDYEFKKLDGKVIPELPDEVEKKGDKELKKKYPPFTLKSACTTVLLNSDMGLCVCPQCNAEVKVPEEITGEEKLKRFLLATKIYAGDGSVEIGTKDIELIKDLIAKSYLPLICGQAWQILDPGETEEKK